MCSGVERLRVRLIKASSQASAGRVRGAHGAAGTA